MHAYYLLYYVEDSRIVAVMTATTYHLLHIRKIFIRWIPFQGFSGTEERKCSIKTNSMLCTGLGVSLLQVGVSVQYNYNSLTKLFRVYRRVVIVTGLLQIVSMHIQPKP